jgi:hypothetical protein
LIDYGNETYHFEYNDFACKVKKDEFQYVWMVTKVAFYEGLRR